MAAILAKEPAKPPADGTCGPATVPGEGTERKAVSPESNALKSLAIYSIGVIAGKLAGFILIPLYTRVFSQADYGVLELVDVTLQAATKVLWGGYPYAVWYFYANAGGEAPRRRVVSTAVWGALLIGCAGAALGGVLAPWLSVVTTQAKASPWLLRLAFVGLACSFPLEAVLCWFRSIDSAGKYVTSGLARLVLQTVCALFLLTVCGLGVAGVFWASAISGLAIGAVLIAYAVRKNGSAFDGRIFVKMLSYSAPTIFVGVCSFVVHFGDRYVLQRFVTLPELAVYSLAYKFGMLITLVQYAFQGYWNAQAFQIAIRPGGERVLARVLTYLVCALCGAGLVVTCFARPVIALLAPPSYSAAAALVPLVCAAYILFAVSAYFQTIFFVKKRTGSDAVLNGMGAVVALAGYALLIPRYGLWGAAAATFLAFAFNTAVAAIWSRRFIAVPFELGRLATVTLPAVLLGILHLAFPVHGVAAGFAVGFLMAICYVALLLAAGFPDRSERESALRQLSAARARVWR
jgi:O-antigen/teichoic acid export membrane protein